MNLKSLFKLDIIKIIIFFIFWNRKSYYLIYFNIIIYIYIFFFYLLLIYFKYILYLYKIQYIYIYIEILAINFNFIFYISSIFLLLYYIIEIY